MCMCTCTHIHDILYSANSFFRSQLRVFYIHADHVTCCRWLNKACKTIGVGSHLIAVGTTDAGAVHVVSIHEHTCVYMHVC